MGIWARRSGHCGAPSAGPKASLYRLAAVDDHGVPDDERGRVRTQPDDGGADLLGFSHAETGCDSSSIRGISVTIDGTRVAEPARFVTTAEQSPLFQAQLPTDNIFGFTEGQVPELLLSPAAHKGFYLYLKPLPPGNHIIKWTATWDCTFGGPFGENITYKLKVLTGVSGQQQ